MNTKLKILIVDDDKRMTRTLSDILTLSGYEVVEAWSGLEALEKTKQQIFDCVLTDIKMGNMDGVELHRKLRLAQPGLPVVLMTAHAADSLISQGLQDGVVGVFNKPLDIQTMLGFFSSLNKNNLVAIVDDDPIFCQTLGNILQHRGFHVMKISDPHTDVEEMTLDTQVILLDMKMDGVGGLEVLKEIRKHHPTLPVLLVTGFRQEMSAAIENALKIDAHACLYKPLEIPSLLQTLSDLQRNRLRKVFEFQV
jgi:CheY-like chemotaxis protein